jgi:hypothetical protein
VLTVYGEGETSEAARRRNEREKGSEGNPKEERAIGRKRGKGN